MEEVEEVEEYSVAAAAEVAVVVAVVVASASLLCCRFQCGGGCAQAAVRGAEQNRGPQR